MAKAVTAPVTATTAEATLRRTRVRFVILALLATGTMINYLDRTVLGIAAPLLTKELGISAAVMGLVFSAFSWTYAASQIPGGLFLDRFGTKLTYYLSLTFWSIFTLLQGTVHGLRTLLLLRFGLGISESPCFPANSRVVATWFPQQERAVATSIYTVGEYVGLAFLSPVAFWLLAAYGWRSLFFVVGTIGLVFGIIWWLVYREPHESSANQAELDYIVAGGGTVVKAAVAPGEFNLATVGKLLCKRQLAGICLGQFAGNSTLVFFLTWFPTYLATERHMGWLKIGFFAIMPFIAASVGVLFGGWWSDRLLRKYTANVARKLPIIIGLLMASSIVAANFVRSDAVVIGILSVAFFAQGMAALGWTLVSDIAPKNLLGLTGGIFNLAANLAGIITPLVIGVIVTATGSFVWALAFISALAIIGALSYIFIVGNIRRIELA